MMKPSTGVLEFAAASLVAAAVVVGPAKARVNGPRYSSIALECGRVQDELDQILDDYADASAAERKRLIERGRDLVRYWHSINCDDYFGNWWSVVQMRVPELMNPGSVVAQPDSNHSWQPGYRVVPMTPGSGRVAR